jgi:hypothetical protein
VGTSVRGQGQRATHDIGDEGGVSSTASNRSAGEDGKTVRTNVGVTEGITAERARGDQNPVEARGQKGGCDVFPSVVCRRGRRAGDGGGDNAGGGCNGRGEEDTKRRQSGRDNDDGGNGR